MKDPIIQFVRSTLGCQCPDAAFDDIERQGVDDLSVPQSLTQRLTVGRRLLIYICELDEPLALEAELPAIVAEGKNERDRRGLNRFRAVIASDRSDRLRLVAERVFAKITEKDAKIHLHIVPRAEVISLF